MSDVTELSADGTMLLFHCPGCDAGHGVNVKPVANHAGRTAGWWLLVGVFCLILLALFVLRTLAWLGWRW